jgi:hypothetical protein
MRIWCTVWRKNGTYQTVPVKAGAKDFKLDKNTYEVTKYYIGRLLGVIHILRAFYLEGCPLPVDIDYDTEAKKIKFNIDSKAITNMSNKKILNVFGEEEFTKLEKIVIFACMATLAVGVINLFVLVLFLHKVGFI